MLDLRFSKETKIDIITRIHPQGKVAPRMFLELARPKSDWIGLGSGGGPSFN